MITATESRPSVGARTPWLLARWGLGLLGFYAFAWVFSRAVLWLCTSVLGRTIKPLGSVEYGLFAGGFAVFFLPLLYLGCCLLARQWIRPHIPTLILYVGTTFFCAVWAEIGADELFVLLLGRPGWTYHVWPVHHGFTSLVGLVMWPMYAFFVYLLHLAIHLNKALSFLDGDLQRAVLVGVDAMVLEVAANAFSLLFFGSYFFHYTAPDLVHFTTAEIFVPYVMAGGVGLFFLKRLERTQHKVPVGMALILAAACSLLAQPRG